MKSLAYSLLVCGLLFATLPSTGFNDPPTLHKPKYARIVLSKDGSKILPLVIDTPSEDMEEYKILYTDKTCNGSLSKIFKPSCKTDYQFHIFSSAEFSPIDMPAIYSETAKNCTKVTLTHYANQDRLAERARKKLESQRRKSGGVTSTAVKVPKNNFYMNVHLEFYEESGPWEYDIYRSIEFGSTPQSAPLITIDEKPTLELELVNEDHRKSEVGVIVRLVYLGERDEDDEDSNRYINNYVRWKHAGSVPEATIRVKAPDGKVMRTYTEDYSSLRVKKAPIDADTGREKKRVSKKDKDTCSFYAYASQRGGSIEVELDLGPMYGVLTASQSL